MARVERAQQGSNGKAAVPIPVIAPSTLVHATTPEREALLRTVRMALQAEVVGAFDALVDIPPAEATKQDREDGRPGDRPVRVRRDGRRAAGAHRRDDPRGHRPRTARAAPRRRIDHRGHGQRPEPRLHRAARQDPARRRRLPQRRTRPADHRPDHHPAGPPHRRVEPARGRPAARRLARQRGHRAALARRAR